MAAYKPLRPCLHPGCAALTHESRCPAHRKRDTRPSARQRGYTGEWERIRAQVMAEEPFCPCGRPSAEVHHIRAVVDGGTHDRSNLVALCKSCHTRATHAEKRARVAR